jgi:hypothetical protein
MKNNLGAGQGMHEGMDRVFSFMGRIIFADRRHNRIGKGRISTGQRGEIA